MKLVSPLPHRKGRLEIIPLIDIMFFLLAAFMLVSINKIKVKSLKVNLPTDVPSAIQEKKEDFISLSIKEDGSIQLDKEMVPNVQALLPKLQALFAANHDQKFLISADQEARHGDVMRVLGRLRSAGFQKVAFSVKPDGVVSPDQAAPIAPPSDATPAPGTAPAPETTPAPPAPATAPAATTTPAPTAPDATAPAAPAPAASATPATSPSTTPTTTQ
jgi:biopolymer transport protein ExbD